METAKGSVEGPVTLRFEGRMGMGGGIEYSSVVHVHSSAAAPVTAVWALNDVDRRNYILLCMLSVRRQYSGTHAK